MGRQLSKSEQAKCLDPVSAEEEEEEENKNSDWKTVVWKCVANANMDSEYMYFSFLSFDKQKFENDYLLTRRKLLFAI